MTEEKTKQICVWNMGSPCEGDVKELLMFDGQIKFPICNQHELDHRMVIALSKIGHDVGKLVQMTFEERLKLVSEANIDLDNVEI